MVGEGRGIWWGRAAGYGCLSLVKRMYRMYLYQSRALVALTEMQAVVTLHPSLLH